MVRCTASTHAGKRCRCNCMYDLDTCYNHSIDCPICLDKLGIGDETAHLHCGHVFHSGCIYKWMDRDDRCPYCRVKTSKENVSS